jgi:hypothetical protein
MQAVQEPLPVQVPEPWQLSSSPVPVVQPAENAAAVVAAKHLRQEYDAIDHEIMAEEPVPVQAATTHMTSSVSRQTTQLLHAAAPDASDLRIYEPVAAALEQPGKRSAKTRQVAAHKESALTGLPDATAHALPQTFMPSLSALRPIEPYIAATGAISAPVLEEEGLGELSDDVDGLCGTVTANLGRFSFGIATRHMTATGLPSLNLGGINNSQPVEPLLKPVAHEAANAKPMSRRRETTAMATPPSGTYMYVTLHPQCDVIAPTYLLP